MKKLLFAVLIMLGISAGAFAQVSATADAQATIITPIAISNSVALVFGNVAVQPGTGGTVIMTPAGDRSTGGAGGVTLPVTTGTFSAAKFTVTGTADYTYNILLPSAETTIDDNALHTMTVDSWESTPAEGDNGLLTLGTEDLYVGGTLHVSAGQAAGTYNADTDFTVTVNYN
jgi:hypothetical protein